MSTKRLVSLVSIVGLVLAQRIRVGSPAAVAASAAQTAAADLALAKASTDR